jgi:hypothetical protein
MFNQFQWPWTKSGIRAVAGFEDEFRPSPSLPVREVIRVRRQWGLRLARRKESRSIACVYLL